MLWCVPSAYIDVRTPCMRAQPQKREYITAFLHKPTPTTTSPCTCLPLLTHSAHSAHRLHNTFTRCVMYKEGQYETAKQKFTDAMGVIGYQVRVRLCVCGSVCA